MEGFPEELEDDSTRKEATNSETLQVLSLQVETRLDPDCNMPRAAGITSPRSSHAIDAHSQRLDEADYGISQSQFDHHDPGGLQFQQTSISNARSLQTADDEPSSSVGGPAMNHTYSSPPNPTIISDEERHQSYNFTLPPISSFGNENTLSPNPTRSNPAIYPKKVPSKHSPNTARELIKFFIDRVAPWVCIDACNIFRTVSLMHCSWICPVQTQPLELSYP